MHFSSDRSRPSSSWLVCHNYCLFLPIRSPAGDRGVYAAYRSHWKRLMRPIEDHFRAGQRRPTSDLLPFLTNLFQSPHLMPTRKFRMRSFSKCPGLEIDSATIRRWRSRAGVMPVWRVSLWRASPFCAYLIQ